MDKKNIQYGKFRLVEDEERHIVSLSFLHDQNQMNWVEGNRRWGEVRCPKGMETTVTRELTKEGTIKETYYFTNKTQFPMCVKRTEFGIYTTFNDNYEDTEICLKQKCHTHIFCGKEAGYIMALQMGGNGPHLGLKMVKGSMVSYSVERDLTEESNDRGDFLLHFDVPMLEAGESFYICWELFWFEDKEDFYKKLLLGGKFPVVRTKQCTYFVGEELDLTIEIGRELVASDIQIRYGKEQLPFSIQYDNGKTKVDCQYKIQRAGTYRLDIQIGEKKTYALFLAYESFYQLIKNRCYFIATKQQYHKDNSPLDGAYLIYDNEEESMYYSHLDDHNGGRERIGMGVLMAHVLQRESNEVLKKSLEQYIQYVYRELYDKETGMVYNDIHRNLEWHRLYNYPWMSVFQLELYQLFQDTTYLKDSYRTMERYYKEGGKKFYGIAIPAYELLQALQKENFLEEAKQLKQDFIEHIEQIYSNSLNYPPFEVRYEQSIVAPAIACLLQGYQITGDEKFLQEAKKQLEVLQLFNGEQPDYHMYEVSIRHWDGKWFGKYRNYGDTYPHYWSALTGIDYALYYDINKDEVYREKSKASFYGCLNLFKEDGRASCAMVYPETVNGVKGHYYDPWANDQDWALYFALKYETMYK